MDQTKISPREGMPLRLRIHLQIGEGKFSSLSPDVDRRLNFWRPEQIGLLRRLRRFWHHGSGTVHVIAPNLMLGAIATMICQCARRCRGGQRALPLRECFITANVSPLTCFASFARLGMAAPRRTSTWTGHCVRDYGSGMIQRMLGNGAGALDGVKGRERS